MTDEKITPRPKWRRHHTVASFMLVIGVFATAIVGSASGSTITRAAEQKLAVEQLVVAADVSYLLTTNGTLYSQGLNNFGQLGTGDLANSQAWVQVKFSDGAEQPVIVKLETQGEHVLALDSDDALWTWGSGSDSALGNGSATPLVQPTKLAVSYSFAQLSAGEDFVVALDSRGVAQTWGQNSQGQLGNGSTKAVDGPTIIETSVKFTSISAGKNFVLALDENKALWAWGSNDAGQFGNGTKDGSTTPILVSPGPWDSVTASRFSKTVMGINTEGELFSWGANDHALLGTGSDWRAEQVLENQRVSDELASIKLADDEARQTIVNELNNARLGELHEQWVTDELAWKTTNPTPEAKDFTTETKEKDPPATAKPDEPDDSKDSKATDKELFDAALDTWNKALTTWLTENPEPRTFEAFSAADKAAIEAAVEEQFEATDVSKIVAAKIPEPAFGPEALTPVKISSVVNWRSVSIGSENVLALDVLDRLWTWGNDANGQTGLGIEEETHTYAPVKVSETVYADIFAGDKWSAAAGKGLYTWGKNSFANPLQSDQSKLTTPTKINNGNFTKLSGSAATGAALQSDGVTVTWGSNDTGVAGQNAEGGTAALAKIEGRFSTLAFSGAGVVALGAGTGNLYFWGSDSSKISASDKQFTKDVLTPRLHTISKFIDLAAGRLSSHVVDANGFVWTWGLSWLDSIAYPGKAITAPIQVPVGAKVTKLAASQTDVMFLTDKNELRWWGAHSAGGKITSVAIPEGLTIEAVKTMESGQDHFVILDESGAVFSFTSNGTLAQVEGQMPTVLTKIELPGAAQNITAGGRGTIALVDGIAYGWGANEANQIEPASDTSYIMTPLELPSPPAGKWSIVALSSTHLLGVSDQGVLYGWGHSKYIQDLGNLQPTKPIHLSITVEGE